MLSNAAGGGRGTSRRATLLTGILLAALVSGCGVLAQSEPTPTPIPTPRPTPTPIPTPTPTPFDQALLDSRVTFMIVGIDLNSKRRRAGTGGLADTIMVASVDAAHSTISMVSLPRDVVDVPLGNGTIWAGKVNTIPYYRGIEALRGALEATYQIDIDYYAAVDMSDFANVIDAFGGVSVVVPQPLYDPSIGLSVAAGPQTMDGQLALAYVRSRKVDSDYARSGRQQQVTYALFKQFASGDAELDLVELYQSLGSLQTDIPLEKVWTLIELARRSADAVLVGQVLSPPRFGWAGMVDGRGWIMSPNLAAMRAYVAEVMGD
jgi:LCP family protein required for cell wall assembly